MSTTTVRAFATEPLDSRYRLSQGGSTLDAPDAGERAEALSDEVSPLAQPPFTSAPSIIRTSGVPAAADRERNARLQSLDPALVKAVVAAASQDSIRRQCRPKARVLA